MFYGKLFVCQTGQQAGQAALHLHPALDLLCHLPVRQGMRVPQHRPEVHWVLLLGPV